MTIGSVIQNSNGFPMKHGFAAGKRFVSDLKIDASRPLKEDD